MSHLKICRICLTKDLKLYHLNQFSLNRYYEEIANNKMQSDNLPPWFCYECAALLHKYHMFKEKCTYGQNTLINLFYKGYMKYEIIEDICKNRIDLLSTINYMIPTKRTKTYNIKYKTKIKPLEKENVLIMTSIINELDEETLKFEYISEPDDEDITVDNIRLSISTLNEINSLDNKNEDLKEEPESQSISINNNYDDDNSNMESLGNNSETEPSNKIEEKPTEYKTDLDNNKKVNYSSNEDSEIVATENKNQLLNVDNGKNTILFSLLKTKPKRNKKKSKEATDPNSKPKKFEKKKRASLNKDHWETKLLSDEEALQQFKEKKNNSKYIKFNFKCTKCFKGFSRNDILLRHNKQCHDGGKFECRFCHMQFKRKHEVGRHMKEHYYVYQCLRCELKCNLLNTAYFHEDFHNGVMQTCKQCGQQFKHMSTYYTHLRMSHRNSHVCNLCGASFVSETGLEVHMKRKHCIPEEIPEEQNADIHCEKCHVSFASHRAYDEHLSQSKLHEGEVAMLRKLSRKEVMEIDTTCPYCQEKFATSAECRKHAVIHRGVKSGTSGEQDKVMCEICGAWLAKPRMEVHLNRHTRKKVFQCQDCGKEFLFKVGYERHRTKHTGILPHECKSCHKRFSHKTDMEVHYRRVHLKEPYPKRNRKKKTDEISLFEKFEFEEK